MANEKIIPLKQYKINEKNFKLIEKMLKKEAVYFCKKHYDLDFNIPLTINKRLTRTYGWFKVYIKPVPKAQGIEISAKMIQSAITFGDMDLIIDVLRHELVHYAMFTLGKQYYDGSDDFENELARLNISSSSTTSQKKIKSTHKLIGYSVSPVYSCNKCSGIGFMRGSINASKSIETFCPKCRQLSKLTPTKEVRVLRF